MSVQKSENGRGYVIKCQNKRKHKMTTIRRNPKTGLNFKTKREAKEYELYYLRHQIDLSLNFDTLFRYYIEDYLIQRPSSSAKDLESWYRSNIQPIIGKKRVVSLNIRDLECLAKSMKNEGYSISYINKMSGNVKTICNYGVSHGFLDKNPVEGYKPLKSIRISEDLRYWTPQQFKRVLDAIPQRYKKSDALYIRYFLYFNYLTGIRKGEQRALQWNNIDFDREIIHVDYHVNERGERIKGRKNGDGYIIVMDKALKNLLNEIHDFMKKLEGYSRKAYVFPSLKKGMKYPLGTYTPTRWVKELAEYCDLPNITFHGLRHSACSYWTSVVGLSPYEVADKLGDTVKVVLDVYADFFLEQRKETAKKIDSYSDKLMSLLSEENNE